jgi:hypothetical protein
VTVVVVVGSVVRQERLVNLVPPVVVVVEPLVLVAAQLARTYTQAVQHLAVLATEPVVVAQGQPVMQTATLAQDSRTASLAPQLSTVLAVVV